VTPTVEGGITNPVLKRILTSPNYHDDHDDHPMKQVDYHNPERLADVMALIQVLALGPGTRRTEKGLRHDLQRPPRSTSTWTEFAEEHPEFFRVRDEDSVVPNTITGCHSSLVRLCQREKVNNTATHYPVISLVNSLI